ncbi:hypothetical protein GCM10009733_081630 [Nonomuraea maheshkhaliensis]|uniref:Uncharacterized protein n=1 Tax=Nonomuraea maheshkhaliensis TaxID=419590 RepID=A0ABP4SMJ8_9ACTN
MIAIGGVAIVPQAASASPGFLYTKWGATCKQGTTKKSYDTGISRYKVGEQHIRFAWGYPTGKSTAREKAYNLAKVIPLCTKGVGPNLWRWRLDYYGLERGKVSRLRFAKHSCNRTGPCTGKAYGFTYGAWRPGWTHEKA